MNSLEMKSLKMNVRRGLEWLGRAFRFRPGVTKESAQPISTRSALKQRHSGLLHCFDRPFDIARSQVDTAAAFDDQVGFEPQFD